MPRKITHAATIAILTRDILGNAEPSSTTLVIDVIDEPAFPLNDLVDDVRCAHISSVFGKLPDFPHSQ